MKTVFANNLRSLCADRGSIALVCRDIGINRQQFNRYLSGSSLPSAHNLRRISTYFGLTEQDMFDDQMELAGPLEGFADTASPLANVASAFSDQARQMRRYLGAYHTHFVSPAWQGKILRSLLILYESNGVVVSHTTERASSADGSIQQRSRYDGLACLKGNRIYLVEKELGENGSLCETIVSSTERSRVMFLRGITMGVGSEQASTPYASRTIWKRIKADVPIREAVASCGVFDSTSSEIHPIIRGFLTDGNPLLIGGSPN